MANADRLIDLFHEAKAKSAGPERDAFLAGACGDDQELKEQVLSLLQAEADDGPSDLLRPVSLMRPAAVVTEKPGDRIGRYKLRQQIGEGGCGVVYMAEQEEPVRRRVALKILKLGLETKNVLARFEAEGQALAMMDHPNIAKVLDAGATEQGRPYFIMELVRGIKITDYCDQERIGIQERLELFIKVCQAIQHAHQKGIIHRDIKPSNILVTLHDPAAAGVPKVIDFGIAKAIAGKLTDATLNTQLHQFIGTPAYMSPEQAEMSPAAAGDIDTRSDIYSLGVLLYELLTGKTPFEAQELMSLGIDALRKTIRENEPTRPSTKLATLPREELTAMAGRRSSEAPKLIHLLKGDLDWIAMKCLEKDRTQRYETASALAADLQRHLHREPVLARRPSALYRMQKSIQRNRLAFASAAFVLFALIGGLCVALWGLVREREARRQADAARREAEAARVLASAESARNEQVARFFMGSWAGAALWRDQDPVFARRFLDRMSDGINRAMSNQPAIQGDLRVGVGNSYAAINDFPTAITNLQLAIQAYQIAFGTQHVRLALAAAQLGRVYRLAQNDGAARSNAQWSVDIARRCNDPKTLADCLLNAAKSYASEESPPPDAIPFLREAMELRRHTVPHLLALLDSTRLLVKTLEGMVADGREQEAKAILEEELRKAPRDGDLRKLRRRLAP